MAERPGVRGLGAAQPGPNRWPSLTDQRLISRCKIVTAHRRFVAPRSGAVCPANLGNAAATSAVPARRSGNRPGGQASFSAPRACLFGSRPFAGFALDVAGDAVLLLGFHVADEIVRRASMLAHGDSLIGSAVLWKGSPGVLQSP
jgi:hypothetical protein